MAQHEITAAEAGRIAIGDLEVNRLGFGAMRITGAGVWGPPPDRARALEVLRRAVALGVDFIDTADSYGPAVSEELIAEALYPYPGDLVIATKGGFTRPGPGQWVPNGHPKYLREACEASLRRLRRDTIDLYQFHVVDPNVPLAESLGALLELQVQGKIRYIGLSNVDCDELDLAEQTVEVVSVQNCYNIVDRECEDVLEACEDRGIAFLPWRPVATADFGGRLEAIEEIAGRHGLSASQVALAWLLQRSPVVVPIPGTGSVAHLEENVAAAGVKLSDAEMETLENLV